MTGSAATGEAGRKTATAELGRFVAATSSALPQEVRSLLKLHILDTFGCQVAFAALPWSQSVCRFASDGRPSGPATISLYGHRVSVELAAFANASFAHGFEMDDTEMRTASHPGVVVVPAALATGQARAASGAAVLTAIAVGYETMIRVALSGVGMMHRGFHTTAVAGPFGAAAAAASIWSLDAQRTGHGLGIAASRASGITQYSVSGGSVKRVHAGIAAQAGIESMALARVGVTAPDAALEGSRGLLSAVSDVVDPARITNGLGVDFELLSTGLKPYCCCAGQHTVIDAVIEMQRRHACLTPESVSRIRVRQNPREADVVGRVVEPRDLTGAQFSAAFGIALRLVHGGNGFHDYLDARLDDPRLLGVARKVVYESTAEGSPLAGDAPCEVVIELLNGQEVTAAVPSALGTAGNPMNETEVIAKFHDLVDGMLGPDRAQQVVEMTMDLENVADISALADRLVAPDNDRPATVPGQTLPGQAG